MSPIENIQPAHATQGGVERHQYTIRHQAEIDQQHLQESAKKKNAEKKDRTQQAENADKAIIREREQGKKKQKKKKEKNDNNEKKVVILAGKNDNKEGEGSALKAGHIDIKI